jgi:hypothetical protein
VNSRHWNLFLFFVQIAILFYHILLYFSLFFNNFRSNAMGRMSTRLTDAKTFAPQDGKSTLSVR